MKWIIEGDALVLQGNNVVSEQSDFIVRETAKQRIPKEHSLTNAKLLPL